MNRGSGNLTNFSYDASQNRIRKQQITATTDTSTYYIRDAQGTVLAVYRQYGSTVAWQEQHLYGSSRVGSIEPGVSWTSTPASTPYFRANPTLRLGTGNTPIQAVDLDGLEPQSVVIPKSQKTEIVNYQGSPDELKGDEKPIKLTFTTGSTFKFNEVAVHLFNLTTKISKEDLRKAEIHNASGSGFPAYDPSDGGGGMTFPSKKAGLYQINLTNNYFEDNRYGYSDYKNDTYEWLEIMAHEVGHIRDIKEIGGSQEYYFGVFLAEYGKEFLRSSSAKKAHDGSWREKRADIGQYEFINFNDFISRKYGFDQLTKLFNDTKTPDSEKINQINNWWKGYQKSKP